MKIRSAGAIVFAFFLAVGASACGDDGGTETGGGGSSADATGSTNSDAGSGDVSGGQGDVAAAGPDGGGPVDTCGDGTCQDTEDNASCPDDCEPVNPCDPNPCTTAPASICDADGGAVSYASDGECTVIDGDASCEHEATTAACGEGEFCNNGSCISSGDPSEYVFSTDASRLTKLALAEDDPTTPDVDEGDCCFDYDGDDQADNGLGGLLQSLGSFLGDSLPEGGVNGLIAEQIASGELAVVFEQVGLDDATNDDAVVLNGFFGANADDGTFLADSSSFIEGTSQPYISYPNGAIVDGVFTAGPSLFSVTIPLGDLGFDIALDASESRIWANVSAGADGGLIWTNGRLGGVVPLIQLADALNGLGSSCACLGLDGAGMLELAAEDKLACTQEMKDAEPACNEEDDGSLCMGIADNAGIVCTAIGILKPDIDTDLSGKKDSFSLGLLFEGEPATISGLAEEAPADDSGDSGDDG